MKITLERTVGASAAALLASSATLVCCVLPAFMVALGAGAALVGLISAIPQLIWLSEHKGLVFGVAGVMLVASGVVLRRAAALPCPVEPDAACACRRLRGISHGMFWIAVAAYLVGAAFVALPLIGAA